MNRTPAPCHKARKRPTPDADDQLGQHSETNACKSIMTTLSLPQLIDDKSPICISFILERLKERTATTRSKPFIIGLNGVQGVGKTTLVKSLANTLRKGKSLETLVLSLDDFYLKHEDQIALAALLPDNALVQVRGEPGRLENLI
jgi:D-glycerate 3-kinase